MAGAFLTLGAAKVGDTVLPMDAGATRVLIDHLNEMISKEAGFQGLDPRGCEACAAPNGDLSMVTQCYRFETNANVAAAFERVKKELAHMLVPHAEAPDIREGGHSLEIRLKQPNSLRVLAHV